MQSIAGALIAFVIIGGLLSLMERIWPARRPAPLLARQRLRDLAFWILNPTVSRILTAGVTLAFLFLIVVSLRGPLDEHKFDLWMHTRSPIRFLPIPIQALLTFAAADFLGYWAHRLLHGPNWLWRIHAVHHATRELDWLSAARNHPLNEAIGTAMIGGVLVAWGLDPRMVGGIAGVFGIWALFIHANVPWRLGFLRFVIATPMFHRWHHAINAPRGGCNFAALFPIWDIVFRTYYVPEHQPCGFGTTEPVPDTVIGQLVYPLRGQTRSFR